MSKILRKAGGIEAMQLALMAQSQSSATFVVSVTQGPINIDALREIIDLLQKHHPLLNSHPELINGEYYFVAGAPKIELTIIENATNPWKNLFEEQVNNPFNQQNEAFMRVFLLLPKTKSDIDQQTIFTIVTVTHHAVCDGFSLGLFHYQIVNTLDKWGKEVLSLPPLPLPRAIDDFLQPGFDPALTEIKEPYKIFKQEKNVPLSQRKTRVVQKQMSPENFAHLYNATKQHHLTIHAALSAAQTYAAAKIVAEQYEIKDKVAVKSGSWFNYRNYIQPKLSLDDFVFYAGPAAGGGAYRYEISIKDEFSIDAFWNLACKIKADLNHDFDNGMMLLKMNETQISAMIQHIQSGGTLENYYSFGTIMSSNAGKENFPKKMGDFTMLSAQGAAGLIKPAAPVIVSIINNFAGTLYCNFLYVEPTLSEATVQKYVDLVFATLMRLF